MIQAIDPTTAEAPDLIRWLAEQSCPYCQGHKQIWNPEGTEQIDCLTCQGTGLANPWASEKCCDGQGCLACVPCASGETYEALIHARGYVCNGSGRVPKDVGLEALFEHGLDFVGGSVHGGFHARSEGLRSPGETPLLAALRAIVKAQMR